MGFLGIIAGILGMAVLIILGSRFFPERNPNWEKGIHGLFVMLILFPVALFLAIKLMDARLSVSTLIAVAFIFFIMGLIAYKFNKRK